MGILLNGAHKHFEPGSRDKSRVNKNKLLKEKKRQLDFYVHAVDRAPYRKDCTRKHGPGGETVQPQWSRQITWNIRLLLIKPKQKAAACWHPSRKQIYNKEKQTPTTDKRLPGYACRGNVEMFAKNKVTPKISSLEWGSVLRFLQQQKQRL